MKNKLLKSLAQNARNRLISGRNSKNPVSLQSNNVKFKIISNEDVEFNQRAKELTSEDELSPLKKLMNTQTYSSLDKYAKERYLLDTIDKYAKYREKLDKEKSSQNA